MFASFRADTVLAWVPTAGNGAAPLGDVTPSCITWNPAGSIKAGGASWGIIAEAPLPWVPGRVSSPDAAILVAAAPTATRKGVQAVSVTETPVQSVPSPSVKRGSCTRKVMLGSLKVAEKQAKAKAQAFWLDVVCTYLKESSLLFVRNESLLLGQST